MKPPIVFLAVLAGGCALILAVGYVIDYIIVKRRERHERRDDTEETD